MRIILFCLSVILIFASCDKKERREAWLKAQAEEETKIEENRKLKAEQKSKTVELAFKEFELGESFSKCVAMAKMDADIELVKKEKGSIFEIAEFSSRINNAKMKFNVYHYQDTITSLTLFIDNFELHKFLEKAYLEKYGNIFLFEEQEKKREKGDDSYLWEFKNGSIEMVIYSEKESKIKVKKGRENLNPKNLQNYEEETTTYFKSMLIQYVDSLQNKKMQKVRKIENEKSEIINKHRQDSIARVQQALRSKAIDDI